MRRRIAALVLLTVAPFAMVGCAGTSLPAHAQPSPSAYVLLDIGIDKGAVTPTGLAVQAVAGQPIVVRVTADEYDELQVGSAPELRFGVDPRARAPQVFQFTVDAPGQVDVELLRESGCPNRCARTHQSDQIVATIRVQAPPTTGTSVAPLGAGPTREPCELLSPSLAATFAGADVQRQPWGDDGCLYKGSTRSVLFTIDQWPAAPDAPVNHFHVIRPENQIAGLPYNAYWFAAGQNLLVVKDGLLLGFKVSDNPFAPNAQINQVRKAEDIQLADQIVPRVG
jgi:hypothetical protein